MNRFPALFLLLAATACAQDTRKYPSLALRPIETRSDDEPAAIPAPPAADRALDAQLATMTAAVAKNTADFAAAAGKAERATRVRGALTIGSEAWLAGQAALADLEALHGDLLGLVGDFERLATDRGQAGKPPYPALDGGQAAAQAQLDVQTARITAIKASLGEK